jgi:hypothetical protein
VSQTGNEDIEIGNENNPTGENAERTRCEKFKDFITTTASITVIVTFVLTGLLGVTLHQLVFKN